MHRGVFSLYQLEQSRPVAVSHETDELRSLAEVTGGTYDVDSLAACRHLDLMRPADSSNLEYVDREGAVEAQVRVDDEHVWAFRFV